MKKIFLGFSIMLLAILSIEAKTAVAVMPFSSSNVDSNITFLLQESLINAFVNLRVYTVVERFELNKAIKELSLQNTDEFDDQFAGEIGKMIGAEIVFFGNVVCINGKYHISLRGVKTISGEIVCSQKAIANSSDDFMGVCTRICNEVSRGQSSSSVLVLQYTKKEQKFIDKYIESKWGIDVYDKQAMLRKRNGYLAGGIVLACFIVLLPFCGIPFSKAYMISKIYKKSTGQSLAFSDSQCDMFCAFGKKKLDFSFSIAL